MAAAAANRFDAADALRAFLRGEESQEAETGGLLIADVLLRIRAYLTGG